jgi:hypothetical protein
LRVENIQIPKKLVLVFFGAISIYSLITFGVDPDRFIVYNLFYEDILSRPDKYELSPLVLVSENQFIRSFHSIFAPLISSVLLNQLAAVILGMFSIWFGYVAIRSQTNESIAFLIATVIGMLAHSFIVGVDTSGAIFDRKAVSSLLVILTIMFLSKNHLFWAFIPAAIGLLVHPLDTASALGFFLPGYVAYLVYRQGVQYRSFFCAVGFGIPLAVLAAGFYISQHFQTAGDITEWYLFSLMMDANDVALFEFFRASYGISIFATLFAAAISWERRHSARLIDIICMSFPIVIVLILILEMLHLAGAAFHIFSEFFIALQFRRGFWLVLLIATARILLFAFDDDDATKKNFTRLEQSLILPAILIHSLPVIGVVGAFFLFQTVKNFSKFARFLIAVGAFCLSTQFVGEFDSMKLTHEILKGLIFLGLGFSFYFLSRSFPCRAFFFVIVFYSAAVFANNNLRGNIYVESLDRLSGINYWTTASLLNAATSGQNQATRDQAELLLDLNKINLAPSRGVLFASPALGYAAPVLSNQAFVFSRWDNTLMFKKELYHEFIKKIDEFNVDVSHCASDYPSGMACVLNSIQNRIERMSLSELERVSEVYPFRYVIRKAPLGTEPVLVRGQLKVYDIINR